MTDLWNDPAFWTVALFLGLIFLRLPIALAMGATAVFVAWYWDLGVQVMPFNFAANVAKVPLLAIPFFIFAGSIMERAGIAEKLIAFIKWCIGGATGGLAISTVIVAALWGAISGSGPATVAALGVILIPGMLDIGYDKAFATSVVSVSSGLAIIIPPSIAYIVYASITSVSIGGIFAAGIVPGLLVAAFLCVSVWLTSREKGYLGEPRRGAFLPVLFDAVWALLCPVIILGGIYGGVFTPTEAAAVAIFYGLFVGVFIYRKFDWRAFRETLSFSASTTAIIMILIACGGMYSWVASAVGLIDRVSSALLSISDNPAVVLLMINIMLLLAGMLMGGNEIFYIFVPLLMPVMRHFRWDPVWFGVMATINIAIGQITPPVAANLFVGSSISGLPMEKLVPHVLPLLFFAVAAMALVTFFPQLTLFLPRWLGMM
ncbi:MAG: TRAP transporter large permease [Synergistaceae bacterium]|jgi:C4-dicarboxylate transporter DctM subunit|nr:TRAP transporter large permease [Synergistaceae bacterium]